MVARIHPDALAELAEAAAFYEGRAPGLGREFNELRILAVAHQRRRPGYWKQRS